MEGYKYYLSLTSQLPFCSVPLRLDSYNSCQFACAYCFAKARGGRSKSSGIQSINPSALLRRFQNVQEQNISGATEEFLSHRIPIQFGGMTDPFSTWEKSEKKTLESLRILAENDYPVIISSKGILAKQKDYLDVLAAGNFYYRISVTVVATDKEGEIEKGVPSIIERLQMAKSLSDLGVPISLRFQPLFYGHENKAIEIAKEAKRSGVKHISLEYLKLPIESNSNEMSYMLRAFPDIKKEYLQLGAKRVGREYVLPIDVKLPRLLELKTQIETLGIKVGLAENEFLHFNNFKSCCNGADLFLKNANFFEANILGLIKNQKDSQKLYFNFSKEYWLPKHNMFSHLNSNSRPPKNDRIDNRERWIEYIRAKWNSDKGRGGPLDFHGIKFNNEHDEQGNKIFIKSPY